MDRIGRLHTEDVESEDIKFPIQEPQVLLKFIDLRIQKEKIRLKMKGGCFLIILEG